MHKIAEKYFNDLGKVMESISGFRGNEELSSLHEGIKATCGIIISQAKAEKKLMFIGNEASASIASHMSTDFWKNGGMRAMAFTTLPYSPA